VLPQKQQDAGMRYTLPDGAMVRIMEPSGQAPLIASFTDSYGNLAMFASRS